MALGARAGADAVGGFEGEEGFVAEDGVERLELAGQVLLELLGGDPPQS